MRYLTHSLTHSLTKRSIASLLLGLLVSGAASANSYSAGNGQALGTNAVAIGQNSYATSVNGMATGANAVATGEGMSREQYEERQEVVADIVRQVGEKQNEISAIDAQIYSIQSLIDGIERRISDINQRQAEVAVLLQRRSELENQRNAAQQALAEQQNQLSQANEAYNRVSKDAQGNSIYANYDQVFSKLDWKKLDNQSGNGRTELAQDIKAIIEADFPDLSGTFTDTQYRELIDGYVARKATAATTAQYLRNYIDSLANDKFNRFTNLWYTYGNLFADTEEFSNDKIRFYTSFLKNITSIEVPDSLNFNGYFDHPAEEGLTADTFFALLAKKEGSNSKIIIDNYFDNYEGYHNKRLIPILNKLPPISKKTKYGFLFKQYDQEMKYDGNDDWYAFSKPKVEKILDGNMGPNNVHLNAFKNYVRDLEKLYQDIDYSKKDSWWFDLDDYKEKLDNVREFNRTLQDYLDLQTQLKVELSKPSEQQDKIEIDRINEQLLAKRTYIESNKGNKDSYFYSISPKERPDIIKKEFEQAKPYVEEILTQYRNYIQTYDNDNTVIKTTREKAEELKQAINTAEARVNQTQQNIQGLINQIANLGLKPDDDVLEERRREQEQLLTQRRDELEVKRQELAGKQADLDKLNQDLANSSLANLGKNSMAEGNNAFASGENAIAYGADASAVGKDSTAVGSKANAAQENATALGSDANALGKDSTAVGAKAIAAEENATAVGSNAQALDKDSTALGANAVAMKENSTAVGSHAQALGTDSTALGAKAVAAEENATAVGSEAKSLGKDSTALGTKAVASKENAMAAGSNAQALGVDATALGTEAVAMEENAAALGRKAQALGKDSTALGTEAVAAKENAVAMGSNAQALAKEAMAIGTKAVAAEENATALGNNAKAMAKDAMAIGTNAVAAEEKTTALGINTQALGSASTVLGSDALAAKENATALGQNASALAAGSVALGQGSLATAVNEVSVGNELTGLKRKINNVANGLISDSSSETVTGQQLYGVAQILGATITSNGLLEAEFEYYQQGDLKKTDNVKDAIKAVSENNRFFSVNSNGNAASAKGEESLAIGGNSAALGVNSVAIGSGSVATGDNEFSVGNGAIGLARRITNVADGIADNDAATVGQLNRGIAGVEKKLQKTERRLSGGIAGAYAAASLVNASAAGDNMLSVGSGTYNGAAAIAVGYSKVSDNGKVYLKFVGSANNKGEVGGGASVGLKF